MPDSVIFSILNKIADHVLITVAGAYFYGPMVGIFNVRAQQIIYAIFSVL
jgi:hypothetical protein